MFTIGVPCSDAVKVVTFLTMPVEEESANHALQVGPAWDSYIIIPQSIPTFLYAV